MANDPNSSVKARKIMAKIYGADNIAGMHVHHIDFNPFNNDISNLEILTVKEHRLRHAKEKDPTAVILIIHNVPEETRKKLKIIAAEEGKPMQRLVLDLIRGKIKERGGE